jgi:hypothetical protein
LGTAAAGEVREVDDESQAGAQGTNEGRTAMEVEAASVMGVLRLFDRRFGRGNGRV